MLDYRHNIILDASKFLAAKKFSTIAKVALLVEVVDVIKEIWTSGVVATRKKSRKIKVHSNIETVKHGDKPIDY